MMVGTVFAALSLDGGPATVALDVHLDYGRVTDEAIDRREGHGLTGEDLPHSPNGWLAVTSKDRRS